MHPDLHRILEAKAAPEPDRASIKWGKRKFRLVRGKTQLKPRTHYHPGTTEARKILLLAGKCVSVCECCESEDTVQIHHKNKNPFDNNLDNLSVLCNKCHMVNHHLDDGVKDDYEGAIMED